jgi:hypothetical protein
MEDILIEDRATNAEPDCGVTPASTKMKAPVDRSAIFQRLRSIWPLVEKLISIERARLRAEGRNRRDSGNAAWRIADTAFRDDSIRLAAELTNLLGSTPPNLSIEQVLGWRLAILVVSACTQRSSRLVEVATALVVQSRLRAAMNRVGDYRFESRFEADIQKSLAKFSTSKETCLEEIDRLTEANKSIEHSDQNDEFADEVSELLEALSISRDVIEECWETTGLSLPEG